MTENYSDLQLLKAFLIKRMLKLKKEQKEFFEEIKRERGLDDLLSVNEVLDEYKISRSTFDRWRAKGLRFSQKSPNSSIRVKRKDLIKYLNSKSL